MSTMNVEFNRSYSSFVIVPVLMHGYSLKVVLFGICLLHIEIYEC